MKLKITQHKIFHFKDWKIRTKISASFIITILLFLLVIAGTEFTIDNISNKKMPLMKANDSIRENILQLREDEKDFLLRDTVNPYFYQNGSSTYLNSFETNYTVLVKNLNKMKENVDIKKDSKIVKEIDDILENAKLYHSIFNEVVKKQKARGFEDSGLEGNMRVSAHTLEVELEKQEELILLLQARRAEKDYFLRHNTEYADNASGYINELKKLLQASGKKDEIKLVDDYYKAFTLVVKAEQQIGLKDTDGLKGQYRTAISNIEPLVNNVSQYITDITKNETTRMQVVSIISIVVIFALVVLFGIIMTRLITKPINTANTMMKDISEGDGDLTKKLTVNTKDEIGVLAERFNIFTGKVKDIISLVQSNASTLASAAGELSVATEQANYGMESIASEISTIADGVQSNASIVEEATASIQELANDAIVVSEESEVAAQNSHKALTAAKQGADKLKEVEDAMEAMKHSSQLMFSMISELKETSSKVSDIAVVITDISQQTNLLALNASIEAARAGDSGKGFAVVADEVRKLADETKKSADSISGLIHTVGDKIEMTYEAIRKEQSLVSSGVVKTQETDVQFKNILELISETSDKITIITQSAKKQSEIANEMTKAMDEISSSTQQSALSSQQISAGVQQQVSTFEELSASIEELNSISIVLKQQTERFKTQ